jgi:hypothetical protein
MADDPLPKNVFESRNNGRIVPGEIEETRLMGEQQEVVRFEAEDPTADRVVGLTLTTDEFKTAIDRGQLERTPPDPRALNKRRSPEARAADRAKDAPLTTDPGKWVSDPDEYDFPGVDTGPTFREEEGDDFDTDSFFDSLF